MICCSLVELFIQYKVIGIAFKSIWHQTNRGFAERARAKGKTNSFAEKHSGNSIASDGHIVADFATPEQQVEDWMWMTGLVATAVMSMVICHVQWQMHPGFTFLALILAFLFSFLCIQISAVTDVTPLTAAAKASQLVMGGATSNISSKGNNLGVAGTDGINHVAEAQKLNLIAGSIAAGGADVAVALASDFRTGFLLRTPPNKQWYAQMIGTFVSVWLAPGIFVLFTSAYPCINDTSIQHCPFAAPSVAAWAAVARAVTDPDVGIPLNSGIFAIVLGATSVIQAILRHFYLQGSREKYQKWLPNWGAIALGFVIPGSIYSIAAVMGAVLAAVWRKWKPVSWETYGFAVAAGMIAGEEIGRAHV